jgi:hypothetical protein
LKQSVDVAATLKSVAAAASDEFDRATLESVRTKAHQRAETSSRNGNALEAMCLDTLCQSIDLVQDVLKEYPVESEERRQLLRRGLQFIATSQSALRRVAQTRSITGEDAEQSAIFGWLKRITRDHGVFIERHMKLEDVADPVQLPELRKEIEPLLYELRRPARIRKTLQRIEYKLSTENDSDSRLRWEGVMRDIDTLIHDEDVQPSHSRLSMKCPRIWRNRAACDASSRRLIAFWPIRTPRKMPPPSNCCRRRSRLWRRSCGENAWS